MQDAVENSKVCQFYKGKNVFLTGGSGFLGKSIAEKLIRVCDIGKIYVLIRPKKGKDTSQRLQELFSSPEFLPLREAVPNYMDKIEGIHGDVSLPELGLSDQAKNTLIENCNVVIHAAATVNFNEKLPLAIRINVSGTKYILDLCHQMKHVQSIIHISTAFAHCYRDEIDEKFYDMDISGGKLIKICEMLIDSQVEALKPIVIGEWPNTYTYTKAAAEDVIRQYGGGLPVLVYRPSIVIGSYNEPVPGWIGNLYGPTGLTVGAGAGVVRTINILEKNVAEVVPIDFVVNSLLVAGFKRSTIGPEAMDIPIYNYVSSKKNPITWKEYISKAMTFGLQTPSSQALWYYSLTCTANPFLYAILSLLLHKIPGLLADTILFLMGKKPQALRIYQKIDTLLGAISYFTLRSWNFHDNNVQLLLNETSDVDKELFQFDIKTLDWDVYAQRSVAGIRQYIFKEGPETIPAARRKMMCLYILHQIVRTTFYGLMAYIVYKVGMFVAAPILSYHAMPVISE